MKPFISHLFELFQPRRLGVGEWIVQWLDVLVVAFLIYRLLLLVRGPRPWQVITGVIAFLILLGGSKVLGLNTLNFLLERTMLLFPVALVIIFLPELRAGLEGLGKIGRRPIQLLVSQEPVASSSRTIDELARALLNMANERIGAIIVVERTSSLREVTSNGVELQARVSAPLLESLFYEGNPLHDGAVILNGDVIVAAGCRLPLSDSTRLDQDLHMRHRAAVGVTENYDCIVFVVSEERGGISWASEGRLRRLNNPSEIREVLLAELRGDKPEQAPQRIRRRDQRKAAATEAKS